MAANRLNLSAAAHTSARAATHSTQHIGALAPVTGVLTAALTVLLASAIGFTLGFGLVEETTTSIRQARLLSPLARAATYEVAPGAAESLRLPARGPYDHRLGYTRISDFSARLRAAGFRLELQARQSAHMQKLADWGISPLYREKGQAGLRVNTPNGIAFESPHPRQVFASFDDIARPIVDTLLYIEDRGLLTEAYPMRNPAVKWPRLVLASASLGLDRLGLDRSVPGASTLATQLEKLRHSPLGITDAPREKLRQMASASLRAYRYGTDTRRAREEIVTDYLNSVSLAAMPGYGEIIGLPAGLAVWFGADYEDVSRALRDPTVADARSALAYREALTLLLAAGRPSYYLLEGRAALARRTDIYLRLLAADDVISDELATAAARLTLSFAAAAPHRRNTEIRARAATASLRTRLAALLGAKDLYELERLDLAVETTTVGPARRMVESMLVALNRPAAQLPHALRGNRLLASGDPEKIAYSVSLYELGEDANRLRLHADSLDSALDTNAGLMLDLGSTAKLRTLATYLQLVADLYDRLRDDSTSELQATTKAATDVLTSWTASTMASRPSAGKTAILEAAMARRYSADPNERFFTGGGYHRFSNFDDDDDSRTMTVSEALRRSVNLVFIRLMRDVVDHVIASSVRDAEALLADRDHPGRLPYLERAANDEALADVRRLYAEYAPLTGDERHQKLLAGKRLSSKHGVRLAKALASAEPLDAVDAGYGIGLDPLAVWIVHHLEHSPTATLGETLEASRPVRHPAYRWLLRTRRKHVQDRRIQTALQREAFNHIHAIWKRHGYPFPDLVPSYATALGSSADHPAGLAELMGVIAGDGLRRPTIEIERLRFAEGTPFETVFVTDPAAPERVMDRSVARTLRAALRDVVSTGTGRRANAAAIGSDGRPLVVAGKTGTGDHVAKSFDANGNLIASRAVSRAATFAFIIGERHYGVVTAYVHGKDAGEYVFTSALATEVFRRIAPALVPVVENQPYAWL
ncbi:MAG: transglycosylase domain-containing protein [Candidatus Binatia bacterium]